MTSPPLVPLALCLTLLATLGAAQDLNGNPEAEAMTTLDGVFTEEQAGRGRAIYGEYCTACHGGNLHGTWNMGPSIAGFRFERHWVDSTVADLFAYLSEEMPKDDPGILIDTEYAAVLAYILSRNEYPFGAAMELPVEPDRQALITIVGHP